MGLRTQTHKCTDAPMCDVYIHAAAVFCGPECSSIMFLHRLNKSQLVEGGGPNAGRARLMFGAEAAGRNGESRELLHGAT